LIIRRRTMKNSKKKYTKAEARSLAGFLEHSMKAMRDGTKWSRRSAKELRQYAAWLSHRNHLKRSYGV
jgi:hypothetical protein